MALNSAQAIFNLIRIRASEMYQDTVPALSDKSPIGDVATPILTQPVVLKEFTELLGAFIKMKVDERAWSNPLAELIKSAGAPLGEYSAEVATNPVAPKAYDALHPEKILEYAMAQDFVYYYARNVKELFEISIPYEDIKGAFQTYDTFNNYVSMKIASLESGRQLSMYNHIMESIVVNYNAGLFPVSDVLLKADNYAKWVTELKTAVDDFAFPNTKYNRYNELAGAVGTFKAWTNPDDVYIIATNKWINSVNVNFLASVFNINRADIAQRIIKVPEFGYTVYNDETGAEIQRVTTNIGCMVIDRRMFNFTSDLDIDNSFFNERTLVQNIYKHWWATYSISPFGNSLVFLIDEADGDEVVEYGVNNPVLTYGHNTNFFFRNFKNFEESASIYADALTGVNYTNSGENIMSLRKGDGTLIDWLDADLTQIDEFIEDIDEDNPDNVLKFLALMFLRDKVNLSILADGEAAEILDYTYVTGVELGNLGNDFDGIANIVYSINGDKQPTIYKPATYTVTEAEDDTPAVTVTVTQDMIDAVIEEYGDEVYLNVGASKLGVYSNDATYHGYENKAQDLFSIPLYSE